MAAETTACLLLKGQPHARDQEPLVQMKGDLRVFVFPFFVSSLALLAMEF